MQGDILLLLDWRQFQHIRIYADLRPIQVTKQNTVVHIKMILYYLVEIHMLSNATGHRQDSGHINIYIV